MAPKSKKFRFTFSCWKCDRPYSLTQEITGQPTLNVQCPYCTAEATVHLDPFRKKIDHLYKGNLDSPGSDLHRWDFPDVIQTTPPNS